MPMTNFNQAKAITTNTMRYTKQMFKNDFSKEEINHMTEDSIKAFIELKRLGCPVKIWWQNDRKYMDYRGYFWIDAEEYDAEGWLDYNSDYWGSEKLQSILGKHGLYFEWQNSAVACVYKA